MTLLIRQLKIVILTVPKTGFVGEDGFVDLKQEHVEDMVLVADNEERNRNRIRR